VDLELENNALAGLWLYKTMNSQFQYSGSRQRDLVEEAMSETVNALINHMSGGVAPPTYKDITENKAFGWRAITPQHTEPGEKFERCKTLANRPISQTLYYATIWILDHGYANPLPHRRPGTPCAKSPAIAGLSDGDVLLELKKYYATKYHPKWSAVERARFRKQRAARRWWRKYTE